ncbi:MAG: metal-sensing transcriptional repressor [Oscillospiraceae bacterium]|nr:metal-sensing transcriptional repressor [Oscillospiraceae bacterium]
MEEKTKQTENCGCCRMKETPRSEESVRKLENRINRMIGQLGGIRTMLRENRYCGDILVQVAAVESALQNLGYIILQDHMASCVSAEIRAGNEEIIAETMELVKKLK